MQSPYATVHIGVGFQAHGFYVSGKGERSLYRFVENA